MAPLKEVTKLFSIRSRVPGEIWQNIQTYRKTRQMSESQVIEQALTEFFEKRLKKPKPESEPFHLTNLVKKETNVQNI